MKTQLCVSCPTDFKELIEKSAKRLGLNQNDLVIRAVMFYLVNDKTPQEAINLTVNQVIKPARAIKETCKVGHCKNALSGTIGEFNGVKYPLCFEHAKKLAGVPGWKLTG